MYKVKFVIKNSSTHEEEGHELCFRYEVDADNFYNDLENFIEKETKGKFHVIWKSTPEKLNQIQLYSYDTDIKRPYRIN